jgi:hypothetical protein
LSRVTEKLKTPDPTERWGWKVFERLDAGPLAFPYYRLLTGIGFEVPLDRWIKAIPNPGLKYPCGFHLFATQHSAEKFVHSSEGCWIKAVLKVRYRGLLVRGIDETGIRTIVAREMYVPKPELKP